MLGCRSEADLGKVTCDARCQRRWAHQTSYTIRASGLLIIPPMRRARQRREYMPCIQHLSHDGGLNAHVDVGHHQSRQSRRRTSASLKLVKHVLCKQGAIVVSRACRLVGVVHVPDCRAYVEAPTSRVHRALYLSSSHLSISTTVRYLSCAMKNADFAYTAYTHQSSLPHHRQSGSVSLERIFTSLHRVRQSVAGHQRCDRVHEVDTNAAHRRASERPLK